MDVFATALLPSVPYLQGLVSGTEEVVIDLGEHFIRQTSRNRAVILTANGPLALIIPLRKGSSRKTGDLEISYEEPWQQKTWQAILSAYKNAPYFEDYGPGLEHIWMQNTPKLAVFNRQLLNWALDLLYVSTEITYSPEYISAGFNNDYRSLDFSKPVTGANILVYKQVFTHKTGFVPQLSVLDLLMNKGPEARMFIDKTGI